MCFCFHPGPTVHTSSRTSTETTADLSKSFGDSINLTVIDLDPKIPFLGEDEHGNLIEYQRIGKSGQAGDLGEDGFIRSYRGSLIFKKLATYVLEPRYNYS